MRRGALLVAVAAALTAVLAPGSNGRSHDGTAVVIPGPEVDLKPELRVGRRYKLTIRGTGSSRIGQLADFDWLYCFEPATCKTGTDTKIWLAYFCRQEPSSFGTDSPPIPYQPSHTYEFTVERTPDSPGPSPGITNSGGFIFRNMAGDRLGGCGVRESEPGTLAVDPFPSKFFLGYIENGVTRTGPGGTFQIELTDVGSISRPPTTSTTGSSTPQAPGSVTPAAASLNTAVVGHRYSVGASGQKAVSSGGRFTSSAGVYVARTARIHLSSAFTYAATRQGTSVAGSAVVTLTLQRRRGSGPTSIALPLTYRVATAAKSTPDKAAREWVLGGTLVKPAVRGCEQGRFAVGKLRAAYISFSACGVSVFIRPATVTVR